MIVPVVFLCSLLLVPSRSFMSGSAGMISLSVSTCSCGRGSLIGIVVACTRWRISCIRVVRVGKLHASAPNYQPAAPSLSAQGPKCLAARQGSCVAYQLRWNSNVKLSFMPLRGRGANLAAALMFQLSGLPPN